MTRRPPRGWSQTRRYTGRSHARCSAIRSPAASTSASSIARATSRWCRLMVEWTPSSSVDRASRVWSTTKIGRAARVKSAFEQMSMIVEWKSRFSTNCSPVPIVSGASGIAAAIRRRSLSLRRAAARRAAGTSSTSRASRNSSSESSCDCPRRLMLVSSRLESTSTLGCVTYDPPPLPFAVRTRPCVASTRSASRTVARLTPSSLANSCSVGNLRPGFHSPTRINSRNWSAICSYAFLTRRRRRPSELDVVPNRPLRVRHRKTRLCLRSVPAVNHEGPEELDHDLRALVHAACPHRYDPHGRVRRRRPQIEDLALRPERVADKHRRRQLDVGPGEIRGRVLTGIRDAQAGDEGDGEAAVHERCTETRPRCELGVEVHLVRVHRQRREPDVVGLSDRPAKPAAKDVADFEVLEKPASPLLRCRHATSLLSEWLLALSPTLHRAAPDPRPRYVPVPLGATTSPSRTSTSPRRSVRVGQPLSVWPSYRL